MKRLCKFIQLKSGDRNLLCSTALLLAAIRLGLWLLSFQRLRQVYARLNQASYKPQTLDKVSIDKIIWVINIASYYMPGQVKCLTRALATQILLNYYGYSSELRIGVAKADKGQFEAHAWVEHQGIVVMGNLQDLSRYTPMPSFDWCKNRDTNSVISYATK